MKDPQTIVADYVRKAIRTILNTDRIVDSEDIDAVSEKTAAAIMQLLILNDQSQGGETIVNGDNQVYNIVRAAMDDLLAEVGASTFILPENVSDLAAKTANEVLKLRSFENEKTDLFVDKYYEMNPTFEEYLFDCTELREEMIILLASPALRANYPGPNDSPEAFENARINNRWATVKKIEHNRQNNNYAILCEYADGSIRKRVRASQCDWLVKKDSIPVGETIDKLNLEKWK